VIVPFETLTELFEIATAQWSQRPWARAAKPTLDSIARIQRELGIHIPDDFARLAAACPSYGSWLASIGNDFNSASHLTRLNKVFHQSRPPDAEDGYAELPSHFIMLNHGYDGDCDCWDTRVVTASGEHPIVYVCVEAQVPETSGTPFQSFRAYAEHFALHHARHVSDRAQRRRAEQLIKVLKRDDNGA
jgi:hypothetical protein